MTGPDDSGGELESEQPPLPVSRTRMRHEAREVTQLGLQLIALAPGALDQLGLSPELREAIELCQGLKLRARSRQKRLIAQLLRGEDHDAIRRSMETRGGTLIDGITREKQNERWRARFIEEGDPALQDFMEEYPDADRQQLRTFVRGARQDAEDKKTQRAQRELLRAIRAIRAVRTE